MNLWRAGTGFSSLSWWRRRGGTWDPAHLLLPEYFSMRLILRKGPWGAGPTGSPSPTIVPLKELHFVTSKWYLVTTVILQQASSFHFGSLSYRGQCATQVSDPRQLRNFIYSIETMETLHAVDSPPPCKTLICRFPSPAPTLLTQLPLTDFWPCMHLWLMKNGLHSKTGFG